MNRNEKIKLLNDIASGLVPADSLQPQPFLLCMNYGDRIEYKKDGEPITKEEWLRLGGNKAKHITIKVQYANSQDKASLLKKEDEEGYK